MQVTPFILTLGQKRPPQEVIFALKLEELRAFHL